MAAYYNDNDPIAAAWLRELIKQGLIADGDVDERSIADVDPADVAGFEQVHFFAGIGGWSYALRLAKWPDTNTVWTGSCPCQPFSIAGRKKGLKDERHLWPEFFRLIEKCRPPVVFGEQVASVDGLKWLDSVYDDLEGADYAVGAADLCASSVGAPHVRQRLYWVALGNGGDRSGTSYSATPRLACSIMGKKMGGGILQSENKDENDAGWLENADCNGLQRDIYRREDKGQEALLFETGSAGPTMWNADEWLACVDGKERPIKSGIFPVADGIPEWMDLVRGFGNSIVPQLGATFIQAVRGYLEARR